MKAQRSIKSLYGDGKTSAVGKSTGGEHTDNVGGIGGFWSKTLRERKYLLFCFFVPALIMWLIHITMEVYPFGENSVLVLDLNGQYVYFFQALRDILTKGGSFLYSFRRALGGEFLGIIGYYIASPFSAIVALFPEKNITEALLFMFLLKTGLCGLTFGVYIEATRKRNPAATVIFSTLYALCAYAVVMQHNTMWIDNLIYLPLIVLGVESIIKKGKYKLFVITLSLAIMSNFYIGYMMCIFVALYFFYYYFSIPESVRNPEGQRADLIRKIGRMIFPVIVTLMISAVFIWGSYYALTFGKTEFTDPSFAFKQRFDFLDFISKMYFGSYDTVRPEGWPFVYCGMLTFILIPLYFIAKNVATREKIAASVLVVIMVFSFNANPVDMFWHGMQKPNWLNYRYAFMLCFILILMAYKAFECLSDIGYRPVLLSAAGITLTLLVLQKLEYENLPDLTAVWASLGFILVYLFILRGVTWDKENARRTAAIVCVMVVCFEAYVGGLTNIIALDKDVTISKRTGFRDFIDKYTPVVDKVQSFDEGFYRMEKTKHRKINDNMALGMYGVTNSTSTLNSDTIKLLAKYGISSKSHWSKYLGQTAVFDALFGIKYVISENPDDVPSFYERLFNENGLDVYKNPYAMSVASGVSPSLSSLDISEIKSPLEVMNRTVGAMLGRENAELFVPIQMAEDTQKTMNCVQALTTNHIKYQKSDENDTATVKIYFDAVNGEDVLMYIPSDYTRECKLTVNGASKGTYFGNETTRIVNIGHFTAGTRVEVGFELNKKDLYFMQNVPYFYYLDSELYRSLMPEVNSAGFDISYHTEDTLRGTIHVLPEKELIYTSIPYDKGWKVSANGEDVEIFEILGGLCAFRLDPGSYNLEMKYRPSCAIYGSIISVSGVVLFALVWIAEETIKKKGITLSRVFSRKAQPISDSEEAVQSGDQMNCTEEGETEAREEGAKE